MLQSVVQSVTSRLIEAIAYPNKSNGHLVNPKWPFSCPKYGGQKEKALECKIGGLGVGKWVLSENLARSREQRMAYQMIWGYADKKPLFLGE